MSQQIKFFKVTSLPAELVPNSFYYVGRTDSDYAESYLTTSGGVDAENNPIPVVAKMLGNSQMIEELAGEVVRAANEIKVVADIAARDAIWTGVNEENRRSILVLVVDAQADATVDAGAATYVYNKGNNSWVKIAEYESMDLVIQWSDIVGRPNSSSTEIDEAVAQTIENATRIAELQIELDTSQAGSGLDANGSYTAPEDTNYLNDATNLKDADVKLDAALKDEVERATGVEAALQSELDATQAGAGLAEDGAYVAEEQYDADDEPTGAHFIHSASSLKSADKILDAALKSEEVRALTAEAELGSRIDGVESDVSNLQSELDATQVGAGLSNTGAYVVPVDSNYLDNATSLADADRKLDAAIKSMADSVAALGAAFNYVGVLEGGTESEPFDLDSLHTNGKDAGDYYKVTASGWFTLGAQTKFLNVNDGLIFNTTGGFDKIDNTNSEVQGTDGYISVTGASDTGFVVNVADAFKDRVTDLETGLTAAEGDIADLRTDLTAAEGDIADLRTDLTTADLAITDLGTRLGTAEADIDALETLTTTQGQTIASNTASIGGLQTAVNNLSEADVALTTRVNSTENRLDDAETNITALQTSSHTHDNKSVLDDIGADGDNLTYKGSIVSAVWSDAQW